MSGIVAGKLLIWIIFLILFVVLRSFFTSRDEVASKWTLRLLGGLFVIGLISFVIIDP
jgi:hypothetical protein